MTQEFTGVLVAVTCGNCGVTFGLDDVYQKALVKSHATFYCPNGHASHYLGESEADKLRRQLEWAQNDATSQRERREAAERSRAALKGQVTRIKNRVAAGKCPCCRTKFADLASHMAESHPDFAGSPTPSESAGSET